MYQLSIWLPSIRVHQLQDWYNSVLGSLDHEIVPEIVVAGPFRPPYSLLDLPNFKWIETFSSPTVASQLAALACSSDIITTSVDDAIFIPGALKRVLKVVAAHEKQGDPYVVGLPYREGKDFSGQTLNMNYWAMGSSYNFPSINPNWLNTCHFLTRKETFLRYGGFDCRYEYLVHASAAWLNYAQRDGVRGYVFPGDVTTCCWYEGVSMDHKPINDGQLYSDYPLFVREWNNQTGPTVRVDPDNWKNQPETWERRFQNKKPASYAELYPDLV
jgi:hypothetical protein